VGGEDAPQKDLAANGDRNIRKEGLAPYTGGPQSPIPNPECALLRQNLRHADMTRMATDSMHSGDYGNRVQTVASERCNRNNVRLPLPVESQK
jgi:hypothetical protein